MPLLGAIGNASEYSFRGTYDNYPFDIDFGDLIDAEPGQIYTTLLKFVEDINYKVPISITGDGEYYVGNVSFNKTFDNTKITLDQTASTFDTTFPELDYSTLPSYVRNGNTVGLRIFGAPPSVLETNLTVVDRSSTSYNIPLSSNVTVGLRDGDVTFSPQGSSQFDNRTFQGSEIGLEYYDRTYTTTITLGKKDFTWTVKTKKGGLPENFQFQSIPDVNFLTEVTSDVYNVQGLTDAFDYTADITSSEGFLSVNYGEYVKSATVKNGDILRLKVTSSNLSSTPKTVTVSISLDTSPSFQRTASWEVITLDNIPSNLSFTDLPSAELNAEVLSEIITIDGLSDNINFNVSITSTDGSLSVNGSSFVKSSTIKNGEQLQLKLDTTRNWLEEKTVTVKLENTTANWKVTNRTIEANSDPNADNLIAAVPFEEIYGFYDATNLVRSKSQSNTSVTNNVYVSTQNLYAAEINNESSKYYLSSYKMAKGTTTQNNSGNFSYLIRSEIIGFSDFTLEMWVNISGYDFNGNQAIWLYNEPNTQASTGNGFGVLLTSTNWNTGRGKIVLNEIRSGQSIGIFIGETIANNLFNLNQWNHVAVTRQGSAFTIYVNGVNRGSSNYSLNMERTYSNIGEGEFSRAVNEDIYIQDLRLYKGVAKYTSNFNNLNVSSIMEPIDKQLGQFYTDASGRILILSCTTPGKDPRTLTKVPGIVLPGTDTCIDDERWQNFLNLARTVDGYRLAPTLDNSTTAVINPTTNNIRRMINANILTLRSSLTDFDAINGNLAWDETSGADITGLDYSLLNWTPTYTFGYYGQSSNPFFDGYSYSNTTANWWILPPGVPNFSGAPTPPAATTPAPAPAPAPSNPCPKDNNGTCGRLYRYYFRGNPTGAAAKGTLTPNVSGSFGGYTLFDYGSVPSSFSVDVYISDGVYYALNTSNVFFDGRELIDGCSC